MVLYTTFSQSDISFLKLKFVYLFGYNENLMLFISFFFLQSMFGLPCSTTCDSYMLKEKLQQGFNLPVIKHASQLYNGGSVIEASDEARAL